MYFHPIEKLVVSASWDKTVRLWDIWVTSTGKHCGVLEGHFSEVKSVVLSPGGKLVAFASWDKTVSKTAIQINQHVKDNLPGIHHATLESHIRFSISILHIHLLTNHKPHLQNLRTLPTPRIREPYEPTQSTYRSDRAFGLRKSWSCL